MKHPFNNLLENKEIEIINKDNNFNNSNENLSKDHANPLNIPLKDKCINSNIILNNKIKYKPTKEEKRKLFYNSIIYII